MSNSHNGRILFWPKSATSRSALCTGESIATIPILKSIRGYLLGISMPEFCFHNTRSRNPRTLTKTLVAGHYSNGRAKNQLNIPTAVFYDYFSNS